MVEYYSESLFKNIIAKIRNLRKFSALRGLTNDWFQFWFNLDPNHS